MDRSPFGVEDCLSAASLVADGAEGVIRLVPSCK